MRAFLTCLAVLVIGGGVRGAELRGAAAVLEGAQAPVAEAAAEAPSAKLLEDMKGFGQRRATLTAEQAAQEWLALADRVAELKPDFSGDFRSADQANFAGLVAVMPGPDHWPALIAAIEARPVAEGAKAPRDLLLRLFAHTLAGDAAAQKKDYEAILQLAKADPMIAQWYAMSIGQVLGRGPDELASFEAQIQSAERGESPYIRVPDLVALAGEEKARALLKRVLLLPAARISFEAEGPTTKLAREVALEVAEQLPSPRWEMINDIDATSMKLYEAMATKFPPAAPATQPGADLVIPRVSYDSSGSETARAIYLFGLIAEGRKEEAGKLLTELTADGRELSLAYQLIRSPRPPVEARWAAFLRDALREKPDLPIWGAYEQLAKRVGAFDEMLDLARRAAESPDLSPARKPLIQLRLAHALIAADQVDEGVATLLRALEQQDQVAPNRDINPAYEGIRLARIGRLLDRQEWIDRGLKLARENINTEDPYGAAELVEVLIELDRLAEAEALLAEKLAALKAAPAEASRFSGRSPAGFLIQLCVIYHRAGRHEDVVFLLDRAKDWGAADLAGLYLSNGPEETPLGYVAAAALAKSGKRDEAVKILDAVVSVRGGYDPAYELLLELEGDKAVPRLDAIFKADRFEERPLIWKAESLRRGGKLDEAEAAVKQAIAIDPSDGEQPRGNRMRAYAVLAKIYADRGDQAQAKTFEQIVAAIRLSEEADQFYDAGMARRGVRMYRESLDLFADAYCIQSRLAVRLSELGRNEEAKVHFQRAYELMPDSFGRMESHCFGCEGVFSAPGAATIAENVFNRLLQAAPDKPQVHYLLGYLRDSQQRHAEATKHYLEAVRLDPDYINAWAELRGARERGLVDDATADRVALSLIRLDPQGRHHSANIADMRDLASLWRALEAAAALQRPRPEKLYPLTASAESVRRRDEMMAQMDPDMARFMRQDEGWERGEKLPTPGEAIAQNRVVSAIAQVYQRPF